MRRTLTIDQKKSGRSVPAFAYQMSSRRAPGLRTISPALRARFAGAQKRCAPRPQNQALRNEGKKLKNETGTSTT
jgi:hypothetical protein